MENILLVLNIIFAIILVLLVLFQKSEGGALGIGVSQENFMFSRTAGNFMTKATAIIATLFIICSLGLTILSRAELAPTIRINAIAPTVTDTELASKLLRNDKMIENITDRHPLKKFLNPEEVASMAEFLLSDKTASISGQVFEMDYGIVSFKI